MVLISRDDVETDVFEVFVASCYKLSFEKLARNYFFLKKLIF